ncbi:MAG: tetratricopeptide repeat protein [Planctomycetaceae bacterium]
MGKLKQIVEVLTAMENRSPGQQALRNAQQHAGDENWAKAIDDYDIAIELDPELTSAYSGRGHSRLQLDQLDEAAADFRSTLERNPFDGMSVTGLGIVLVRQGDIEEGIQLVEEAAERFPDDWVFLYNSACVFGRALEATSEEEPSEIAINGFMIFQAEAMKKLRLSAEQGMPEFDFMKRDPDLRLLRDLPPESVAEVTSRTRLRLLNLISTDEMPLAFRFNKIADMVCLNRIYTRSGDQGQTSLGDGTRVLQDQRSRRCTRECR